MMDSKSTSQISDTVFDRLKGLTGSGTELISLYVPASRVPDAQKLLKDEIGKASNIKSSKTRNAVIANIKSVQDKLKTKLDEDCAIFVGDTSEGWISERYHINNIKSLLYRCGSSFFLDPIINMLDNGPSYAILVLDLHDMMLATVKGSHINYILDDRSYVMSKHGRGGQSARRFEKNRQLEIKSWFNDIGNQVNDCLLSSISDLDGIIIGGPGMTKDDFYNGEYLDYRLRNKILDIVNTGYCNEQGIKEILSISSNILSKCDIVRQTKLYDEFLYNLATNNLVSYTRDNVLDNIGKSKVIMMTSRDAIIIKAAEESGCDIEIVDMGCEMGKTISGTFGGYISILRYH